MTPMLATLAVGILIGYMGQRSRFCTISGIRDFFLFRDTFRLKGLLGIIAGGAIGYTAFGLLGGDIPDFPLGMTAVDSPGVLIASVIGGLGLGFFSVFSEGCPFRQYVMAAQGRESAMLYLFGSFVGIVYFNMVTIKWLELLLRTIG